ncbi:MAG: aldolase [Microbacterium sp.]|nr:MAG: aldolase [Microbacterium sp.]
MTTPTEWGEIARFGTLLHSAGLTPGTTGNVSVRRGDRMLTSGTGTRLGALSADDWAETDLDGAPVAGIRPTKESALHAGVYRARADVGAIVHLHSPAALAVSCLAGLAAREPLPAYTPYYAMRVRGLTVVDYFRPGHADLAGAVVAALTGADAQTRSDAALLRRHGLVTVGATLTDAVAAAEELEANCDLHLRLWGKPVSPLSAAEIAELRG